MWVAGNAKVDFTNASGTTGSALISGLGGAGTGGHNDGVRVGGLNAAPDTSISTKGATITVAGGAGLGLTISGLGGAGSNSDGVQITGETTQRSTVASTAQGTLLIQGQGGANGSNNNGVYADGAGTAGGFGATVSTTVGDLTISGVGGALAAVAVIGGARGTELLARITAEVRDRNYWYG